MASTEAQEPKATAPSQQQSAALPDYLTNPDAVAKDLEAAWRYGKPPDYTNTRNVWKESKSCLFWRCTVLTSRQPRR